MVPTDRLIEQRIEQDLGKVGGTDRSSGTGAWMRKYMKMKNMDMELLWCGRSCAVWIRSSTVLVLLPSPYLGHEVPVTGARAGGDHLLPSLDLKVACDELLAALVEGHGEQGVVHFVELLVGECLGRERGMSREGGQSIHVNLLQSTGRQKGAWDSCPQSSKH